MHIRMLLAFTLLGCAAGAASAGGVARSSLLDLVRDGGSAELQRLRADVGTYSADGRHSIVDLYRAQCDLGARQGWVLEELFREEVTWKAGERLALPAACLRTERKGPALWILAGIHGEEPAGPDALADNLAAVGSLGDRGIPTIVMPLLNPLGYQRNWRYPDVAVYSETNPGSSVGDSDHLLQGEGRRPRRPEPVSRQAALLTGRVVELAREYPPVLSLDLHEDNLLRRGYLYSQGSRGAGDPVAAAIVALFRKRGFPIVSDGETRFGEPVRRGIVAAVRDGSIDELLSAPEIVVDGAPRKGPTGLSVLVLETSSMNVPLRERCRVHAAVLESLESLWNIARKER